MDAVTCVAFSHDGQLLASKSLDDTVRLWCCNTWETVAVLHKPLSGMCFSGLTFHPAVQRGCPIIPVILRSGKNIPELPIFLRRLTWVHFRKKKPDPLQQLIWGITGERGAKLLTLLDTRFISLL
jgi:hypothetical protein